MCFLTRCVFMFYVNRRSYSCKIRCWETQKVLKLPETQTIRNICKLTLWAQNSKVFDERCLVVETLPCEEQTSFLSVVDPQSVVSFTVCWFNNVKAAVKSLQFYGPGNSTTLHNRLRGKQIRIAARQFWWRLNDPWRSLFYKKTKDN